MKNRTRKKRHDAAMHARIACIKRKLAALSPSEASELILNFFEGGPLSASETAWLQAGCKDEPEVEAQRRGWPLKDVQADPDFAGLGMIDALAVKAKKAAGRCSDSIDDMIRYVEESNGRIRAMEAKEIAPGEILLKEFMEPSGITPNQLAMALGWSSEKMNGLIYGTSRVTKTMARDLGYFFKMEPQFWLNLQAEYDRRKAS